MTKPFERNNGLMAAIGRRGSAASLANALGVTPQAISQWLEVPAERVLDVERITGVSRHRLRQDLYPVPEAKSRMVVNDLPDGVPSERFWMVYGVNGGSPTVLHGTYESAEKEASRLARANTGSVFVVLESVSAIVRNDLFVRKYRAPLPSKEVSDDDIPF